MDFGTQNHLEKHKLHNNVGKLKTLIKYLLDDLWWPPATLRMVYKADHIWWTRYTKFRIISMLNTFTLSEWARSKIMLYFRYLSPD